MKISKYLKTTLTIVLLTARCLSGSIAAQNVETVTEPAIDTILQNTPKSRPTQADTLLLPTEGREKEDILIEDDDEIRPLRDTVPTFRDSIPDSPVGENALDTDMREPQPTDSTDIEQKVKGIIERPAFSTAKDSIIEDLEKNIIYYFGDVTAKYDNIELKADYMVIV